jgi:hypothetical protein
MATMNVPLANTLGFLDAGITDDRLFAKYKAMTVDVGMAIAADIMLSWYAAHPGYEHTYPKTFNMASDDKAKVAKAMDDFFAFLQDSGGA